MDARVIATACSRLRSLFVCLPKDPSTETAQRRKLDGDVVAVVIEGSGWVLRSPSHVSVPQCGETWLPSKLVRRQPPCLGRRTGKKIWSSSALPERTEKKRLLLEVGKRQPSGPARHGVMPFAGQELKQANLDWLWSK